MIRYGQVRGVIATTRVVCMVGHIVTNVSVNTKVFVAFSPMVIRVMVVDARLTLNGRVRCVTNVIQKTKTSLLIDVPGRVLIRQRINISGPSVRLYVLREGLRLTTCVVKFLPVGAFAMHVTVMGRVPPQVSVSVTKGGSTP